MKKLIYVLMFLSFFPFVSFINIGTDTQPYAFVIAVMIILLNRNYKIPKLIAPLFLVSALSVVIFIIFGKYGMLELRSLFNYLSITVISYASYLGIKRIGGVDEKYFKIIINIWFIVGLVQKFIKSDFLLFLVAGGRTSVGRGITNLTSEPSFYGYMIIFALLFVLDFKEKRNLYIVNLLVQLFLFSQSAVSMVYLGIYVGLLLGKYILSLKISNIRKVVIIALLFVGSLTMYFNMYPNSRATVLLGSILSNPQEVYSADASVRSRFNHIYIPITEAFRSYLMPNGYSRALEVFGYRRIMSGYGAGIYELGIIGIIMVINIFLIVYRATYHRNNKLNSVFLTIIMFSAIQLASPILAFYIGYVLNLNKSKKNKVMINKKILSEELGKKRNKLGKYNLSVNLRM
ncbi:hypothetical protein TEPIDINF_002139 [Tepidibacillus infernus]|uniref:hypothetical protein n=1 Tax=Tepidibacillus infernus TaxID=1806172 RepID=UPI003B6D21DA